MRNLVLAAVPLTFAGTPPVVSPVVEVTAHGAASAYLKPVRETLLRVLDEAGAERLFVHAELSVEGNRLRLAESSAACHGALSEEGAKRAAQQCAAAILVRHGMRPLYDTRIYYTSVRNRNKEIWVMDWDGANPRQLTAYESVTSFAALSPDNSKLAYTTMARGNSSVAVMFLDTGRLLPFYNQTASVNASPEFLPDGRLLFASTAHGGLLNLYTANLDGSGLRRLTNVRAVETEPKANPRTGADIVFTSGRSGAAQIYRMNLDGTGLMRITTGAGEAGNPAWSPEGDRIAFSWKQAYGTGFQIFVYHTETRKLTQLTFGGRRNENPSWAPDGRHLAFSSGRSGTTQIWTMLADGSRPRQLTHEHSNENPVWSH